MRFVGKRLPDILIGILIVVLAVGLGSLLLTQRNRAAAPVAVVPQATIPAAPGSDNSAPVAVKPIQTPAQPAVTTPPVAHQPAAQPAAANNPATSNPTASQPATDTSASAGDGTTDTAQPATTPPATTAPTTTPPVSTRPTPAPPATPAVPVTTPTLEPPSGPAVDTSKPPVVTTPPPSTGAEPQTTTQPTTQAQTPSHEAAGAHPVATSASRIPLRRDYRVSLGVFDNAQQALARTAAVQALGYKVYPINVGERVVVQVGPFASAQDAQQAQRDIARSYAGAVVLAPRSAKKPASDGAPPSTVTQATNSPANGSQTSGNQANGSQANTDTAPQAATPAKNTTALNWQTPASNDAPASSDATSAAPAPARSATSDATTANTTSTQRPAPSGPVYLQVGAFDRQDSAQKLVGQLEALGYDATVQAPEGKKVTVLIGPFHGAALLRTETRLDSNGLEHFRVR